MHIFVFWLEIGGCWFFDHAFFERKYPAPPPPKKRSLLCSVKWHHHSITVRVQSNKTLQEYIFSYFGWSFPAGKDSNFFWVSTIYKGLWGKLFRPKVHYFSLLKSCKVLYEEINISRNCHGRGPKSQNQVQEHRKKRGTMVANKPVGPKIGR